MCYMQALLLNGKAVAMQTSCGIKAQECVTADAFVIASVAVLLG